MGLMETISQSTGRVTRARARVVATAAKARLWPGRAPAVGNERAERISSRVMSSDAPGFVTVTAQEGQVLVLLPAAPVRVVADGVSVPLDGRSVAILSRAGQVDVHHAGPLRMMVAIVPRASWQTAVTCRFEDPVRLRRTLTVLACTDAELAAFAAFAKARDGAADGAAMISPPLLEALIAALDDAEPWDEVWETVRSLKRATDFILDQPGLASSCEFVAERAGMTPKTLQRQALAYLGMTLSAFIRDARLTAAHHSLSTARDSRSVTQMAADYGFASGGSFTRTYARRYGETPTKTRTRAVNAQA